jgi:hypothetical protein
MKKLLSSSLFLIIIALSNSFCFAQKSYKVVLDTYNSSFSDFINWTGTGVAEAQDVDGLMLLGTYNKYNYYNDVTLTKIDSAGIVRWSKRFTFPFNLGVVHGDTTVWVSLLNSHLQSAQTGYFLVAHYDSLTKVTDSTGTHYNRQDSLIIFKFDTAGNYLWGKMFDCPYYYGYALKVREDYNGSILIMDKRNLLKLDSLGNPNWILNLQDTTKQSFVNFDIFPDNNIVIAAADSISPYLLKIDSSGNFVRAVSFPDQAAKPICTVKAQQDFDCSLLFNYNGNPGCILARFDSALNVKWCKSFAIVSSTIDLFKNSFSRDIVTLYYNSYNYTGNPYGYKHDYLDVLCYMDTGGNLIYTKAITGYLGNSSGQFNSSGVTHRALERNSQNSFMEILQYYEVPDLRYPYRYNEYYAYKIHDYSNNSCFDSVPPAVPVLNQSITVLSKSLSIYAIGIGYMDRVFQLDTVTIPWSLPCSALIGIDEVNHPNETFSIYPNPAHSSFAISFNEQWQHSSNTNLQIFDLAGRCVYRQILANHQSSIAVNQLSAGVYFVRVSDGEREAVEKLIIQ